MGWIAPMHYHVYLQESANRWPHCNVRRFGTTLALKQVILLKVLCLKVITCKAGQQEIKLHIHFNIS